jgi:hypothetical protein
MLLDQHLLDLPEGVVHCERVQMPSTLPSSASAKLEHIRTVPTLELSNQILENDTTQHLPEQLHCLLLLLGDGFAETTIEVVDPLSPFGRG